MAERFQIGASFSGVVTFEPREGDVVQVAEVVPPQDGRGMVVMSTVAYALGREHAERIVRALAQAQDPLAELTELIRFVADEFGDDDDGNAPGHAHREPGIWDDDNGERAGKPCEWCAFWRRMKLATSVKPGVPTEADLEWARKAFAQAPAEPR